MAVQFLAASESALSTSGTSFNWSHTAGGTPRGVLVFTFVFANADDVTAVSYGASSMTAVSGGRANTANATTPGDCKAWFLGTSVPTGNQTITVTRNNNANSIIAVGVTLGSDTSNDLEVNTSGIVLLTADASSVVESSPNDGSPGTNSFRFAGLNAGFSFWNDFKALSDNVKAGANSNWVNDTANGGGDGIGIYDGGLRGVGVTKEKTPGQGARPVGFTGNTPTALPPTLAGIAAVYLAVREIISPTPPNIFLNAFPGRPLTPLDQRRDRFPVL